jgi:hypothetical protein
MASLSIICYLEVIPKKLLIVRVSAVLDNELSALLRRLSTKVCHALLCDDHVDIVLCMVKMTAEWND